MTEREVTAAVINFLRSEGWIMRRQHVGAPGMKYRVGERGMCDWIAIRKGRCFEVEIKATGKKPAKHQAEYIAKMRALECFAIWTDNIEDFREWYIASAIWV